VPRTSRAGRWSRDIAVALLLAGCSGSKTHATWFDVVLPELPQRRTEATLVFEVFFTREAKECAELEPLVAVQYPDPQVALEQRDAVVTTGWPSRLPVRIMAGNRDPGRHVPWRVFGAVTLAGLPHATFCSEVVPEDALEAEVKLKLLGVRPGPLMGIDRFGHTATVLPDGGVVVIGSLGLGFQAPPERWTQASGFGAMPHLALPRAGHTATLLADGRVLVVGGYGPAGDVATAQVELLDPATGRSTPGPSLSRPRLHHTATLLGDGRVLVVGGVSVDEAEPSTELFLPDAGTWTAGPDLRRARSSHTATLLPDGRVLVVGGQEPLADAGTEVELFDPAAGAFTDGPPLVFERFGHFAVALNDGRVLLGGDQAVAELFEPATQTLRPAGHLSGATHFMCAARSTRGEVVAVGLDQRIYRFDPATDAWSVEAALARARGNCAAWALPSGEVLVSGGLAVGENASTATTEVVLP
jgi:Galactose oxidase, central domain